MPLTLSRYSIILGRYTLGREAESGKSVWEELRPRAACHLADGHFDRWYKKQAGRRFRFQLLLDGMLFRGQQLINALPYVSVCLSVVTMFEGFALKVRVLFAVDGYIRLLDALLFFCPYFAF